MIQKGHTPAEYVDLLLEAIRKTKGSEAVREAAREYLVNGGNQSEVARKHGVEQHSLSRLISNLREKDEWAKRAAKYHK
ncbi:transposase [Marinobacterium sp. BA1]|uniref:transposase n=1 Tax=Marinobacterium sp. BA1 TaxID=3138931 RepID=UPI0032E6114D